MKNKSILENFDYPEKVLALFNTPELHFLLIFDEKKELSLYDINKRTKIKRSFDMLDSDIYAISSISFNYNNETFFVLLISDEGNTLKIYNYEHFVVINTLTPIQKNINVSQLNDRLYLVGKYIIDSLNGEVLVTLTCDFNPDSEYSTLNIKYFKEKGEFVFWDNYNMEIHNNLVGYLNFSDYLVS